MKGLKSTRTPPVLAPEDMLRVAGVAAPLQPSAVAAPPANEKSAMLSVRMTEDTLEALASFALAQSKTQRQVIASALVKHGVAVASRDLEDRPQPRRRGRQGS